PGRPLAAGDAGRGATARLVPGRHPGANAVRGADRRRHGRGAARGLAPAAEDRADGATAAATIAALRRRRRRIDCGTNEGTCKRKQVMSSQPTYDAELSPKKRALLALLLQEEGMDSDEEQGIPRRETGGDAPMSFAQQRLWFLGQLAPDDPSYNMPGVVRLIGVLDTAALRRSLAAIVRRHESLRTSFPPFGGQPVQRIAPAGTRSFA